MRILYDGSIYSWQAKGGINRYFNNLISNLPSNFSPLITLVNFQPDRIEYPVHPNLKILKYSRFRPRRLSFPLEQYYFRGLLNLSKFDVSHPTYYSLLTRQEINQYRCPVVLTIYDMIHELFPPIADPNGEMAKVKHKAIAAAQAIICISESTKKDLLERYQLSEEKLTVTHLAAEIDINLADGPEPVPEQPYFLYVGGRGGYKNFDGLLAAFANVVAVQPDVILCVVGSPFNHSEKQLIADLKLKDHIHLFPYPDDAHLAKLYRCSLAFLYPSKYEGFGIPPLEAMACGTPVVTANTSSIPEVVGDAGVLVNPYAQDELTDALLLILNNPAERDRLITKGFARAKQFSWDRTVAQTLEVYRSVAE